MLQAEGRQKVRLHREQAEGGRGVVAEDLFRNPGQKGGIDQLGSSIEVF